MARTYWIIARIAAAAAGTIVVGIAAAVILTVVEALTCGPTCASMQFNGSGAGRCVAYSSTCSDFANLLLFNIIWAPTICVLLGIIPGAVALTFSPAKQHPWRSLPALVLGTLIGFVTWLLIGMLIKGEVSSITSLGALLLIPTITGLVTAWNIDRLPKLLRLQSSRG